jgi:hypothetical protein
VVCYVPAASGERFVSTMGGRAKAKAVARNGKISLCVLDERWPFAYLQVYCDSTIERDPEIVTDVMMGVAWRMSGQELQAGARPMVAAMGAKEGRIVLRCRPTSTFASPPRHLHRNDQKEAATHWLSGSVAWDAPDTVS